MRNIPDLLMNDMNVDKLLQVGVELVSDDGHTITMKCLECKKTWQVERNIFGNLLRGWWNCPLRYAEPWNHKVRE